MTLPKKRLGDVVEILSGFAFDSASFNDAEGMKLIRIRDVVRGSSETYYNGPFDQKYIVHKGDLLIGMDGEFKAALWRDEPSLLNQRVCKIQADERYLFQGYLRHFLPNVLKKIEDATPFVTVKHLSVKTLNEIQIPLPSLAEQQRIAALLDTADNLLRLREAAIEKLDQLIRSVFIEMFGSVRENTKNWPLKSFAELAINEDYKRRPIKSSDRENRNGEYAYYGASGIIDSIDDYIFEGESLLIGEDGANLLARSSPIAFMANGKYWVNNHAHILREHESASLRYLEFFVDQIDLSPYITGSAQPKLTRANLDRIPVPLPPRSLQNRFAEIVKNIERQREAAIIHCEKALGLSKTLQYQSFAVN